MGRGGGHRVVFGGRSHVHAFHPEPYLHFLQDEAVVLVDPKLVHHLAPQTVSVEAARTGAGSAEGNTDF